MKAATTLPRLLHRNAVGFGARPALREKRGGIWQVLNWSDYAAAGVALRRRTRRTWIWPRR